MRPPSRQPSSRSPHQLGDPPPEWYGQWTLPFTLSGIPSTNAEIAHAAVLPPPANSNDARVFFMCRKREDCLNFGPVEGWVWKPNRPGNVVLVADLTTPADASQDAFCSGHGFTPDGRLVVAGGLNYQKRCFGPCGQGRPWGHLAIRQLDSSQATPVWVTAPALQMNRERWYPTVLTLDDGDSFIAGHGTQAEPDFQCAPFYGNEAIHQTWDRAAWAGGAITAPLLTVSRARGVPGVCDPAATLVSVGDYPRLHLLSNGYILFANGLITQFLNIQTPACPGEERWETSQIPLTSVRHGGSTVHILYPSGADHIDVIYAIGGTDGGDDTTCVPSPPGAVHASVDKILSPLPGVAWVSAPALNQARFNHNSVLLLDGSIFVNGGSSGVDGTCLDVAPPLNPERLRPAELFSGAWTSSWVELPVLEPAHRRYHSVGGLLPDGRVFSAGGNYPEASHHSVCIYSPPYYFFARPEILAYPQPATPIPYGPLGTETFDITVSLTAPSNTVKRVALVRNGSITHAWDMNQRYVVLNHLVFSGDWSSLTLNVSRPKGGFVAPPGYYLLTVVEETAYPGEMKLVPSEGVWVRVGGA